MSNSLHQPVLLEEVLQALAVDPSGAYVDATYGRGGHTGAIMKRLGPAGRMIGIDRDPDAIASGNALAESDPRFKMIHACFSALPESLIRAGVQGPVQGILLDLGVSSPQLDTAARGFSFGADGPLDMRMDPTRGISASQWLARADEGQIVSCLFEYGEERFARRIARAIIEARSEAPIDSTRKLAEIVAKAVPTREPGKHPATRTFQALRIQVNDELGEIRRCLDQVCGVLAAHGRLAVISFHSLEDRIVKRFMRQEAKGPEIPKGVPVMASQIQGRLRLVGKPMRPTTAEISMNPRARSAILRVAERLP